MHSKLTISKDYASILLLCRVKYIAVLKSSSTFILTNIYITHALHHWYSSPSIFIRLLNFVREILVISRLKVSTTR